MNYNCASYCVFCYLIILLCHQINDTNTKGSIIYLKMKMLENEKKKKEKKRKERKKNSIIVM